MQKRGYNPTHVAEQFQKAKQIPREQLLKPVSKNLAKKVFSFVTNYNPRLPNIAQIIHKHLPLLNASPQLNCIFTEGSIIAAYRRPKNLKELIKPQKPTQIPPGAADNQSRRDCFKCGNNCDLCNNFLKQTSTFSSTVSNKTYQIKECIDCNTSNIIYLATCKRCNIQYVGSTSAAFKVRFRNHKSSIKKTCEVAIHFNRSLHIFLDLEFIGIEAIYSNTNTDYILLSREAFWSSQLCELSPHGLSKRQEFNSKKRIRYNR